MVKIVIAGSRGFEDYEFLQESCNNIIFGELNLKAEEVTIISGAARGADKLGEQYAKEYGFNILRFPASWELYKKAAGMIRNEAMAREADYIILFDMGTKGTAHMLTQAIKYNVPFKHFLINE